MRHKSYREWLRLSVCDELDGKRKQLLEDHLRSCPHCRSEMRSFKQTRAALSEYPLEQPSTEQLQNARKQLQSSLADWYESRNNSNSIVKWTGRLVYQPPRVAIAAIAILFAGFVLGYGAFSLTRSHPQPQAGIENPQQSPPSSRIENVQFVTRAAGGFVDSASTGQDVEFTFDLVNRVHMKGQLRDSKIQKILALALINERNPGVRLESAEAISASRPDFSDPDIRKALIEAMLHDENPGVRMQAMDTLKSYPFQDPIKKAFLQVLMNDKLPGLRIQAINALMGGAMGAHPNDPEIRNAFKERLVHDENSYIRLQARKFVQENSL